MSTASVQPGRRERQHPGVLRAEALQHREERRRCRVPLSRSSEYRTRRLGAERHDVLVLHDSRAGRRPVPAVDEVERVEERGDRLHADVVLARLAEPHLVERASGVEVDEPGRHHRRRDRERRRHRTGARARAWRLGQLVERRVVAASEDRRAPSTCRARCSRSTRPSSGSGRRARSCWPSGRRGRAQRSSSTEISEVSTGMRSNVASRMTPVRPMPPAVAQKISGVSVGRDRQHVAAAGAAA